MSSATGMIVMKASSSQGNNVSASSVVATDESKKSLEQLKSLKAGDLLANGAFRVEKVEPVPDYQVVSVSLKHVKTGAHWLHIGADDSNNAFNVGFKTVPMDDTGVAHILEHTTLCGSNKYPIRDPFFNMLRRSLSTFMNAMTSADFTCYPFATMNRVDYDNLLSVYLDAVFFPKLEEQDFKQEGHRFEFAKTEDASSGLKYKGVVFNEMKGAMGSQNARFMRALGANLFPTSTFHYNSGGDPTAIPDLTYEQLKAFHALHYHPSNARFYTYGDFPLEETLINAETMALNQFEAIDVSKLDIADESRYTSPVVAEVSVPRDSVVNDPKKTAITSTAWLMLNNVKDDANAKLDNFALSIASDLLLSGPQSYFHEALLEPGYGSGLAPGSGYGNSRRETSFSVGVKGVGEEEIPIVEQKIQETLESVAKSGFPRNRVDSTLHQIELDAAAVKPNFGLMVGIGTMSTWVHDGDALRPLRTLSLARQLQEKLDSDPQYWQNLISKYFLNNQHKVIVRARSDEKYDAKLEEAENALLKELESKLSEDEKKKIVEDGVKLKAAQDGEQNAELLPTLKVAEAVDRSIKKWGSKEEKLRLNSNNIDLKLQVDEQPTNGVVYVGAMFDCSQLPDRLTPYLDYFADYVDQIGTSKVGYKDFAEKIKGVSGGVSIDVLSNNDTNMPLKWTENGEVAMNIGSHCLARNADAMGDILLDVCTDAKWFGDDERLKFLIKRRSAQLGASVAQNGMGYGKAVCASKMSAAGELENRTGGLPQVALAQRLAKAEQAGVEEVKAACSEIQSLLLTPENVKRCRVASQAQDVEAGKAQLAKWLSALPSTGSKPFLGWIVVEREIGRVYPAIRVENLRRHQRSNQLLHRRDRNRRVRTSGRPGALPPLASHEYGIPPPRDSRERRRLRRRFLVRPVCRHLLLFLLPRPEHARNYRNVPKSLRMGRSTELNHENHGRRGAFARVQIHRLADRPSLSRPILIRAENDRRPTSKLPHASARLHSGRHDQSRAGVPPEQTDDGVYRRQRRQSPRRRQGVRVRRRRRFAVSKCTHRVRR